MLCIPYLNVNIQKYDKLCKITLTYMNVTLICKNMQK